MTLRSAADWFIIMSTNPEGWEHIVFGEDPVGVGVCIHFCALSSEPLDGF